MSERLIFYGDLVLPYDVTVDYSSISFVDNDCVGVANLEGAILKHRNEINDYKWADKFSLYSCPDVISILKDFNIKLVSMCNNHILDYKQPIETTEKCLDKFGIKHFGLKNHEVSKLQLNDKEVYIITFSTSATEHRLNVFNPNKVINEIKGIRAASKDALIVIYPHWGIERFYYPEPGDRSLAHKMVDAGANLIVGHHPHLIQPIEVYKGVTIVYSIGNFILPQTYYGEKKLMFHKDEILDELVVVWDGENIDFKVLRFDEISNKIYLSKSQSIEKYLTLFREDVSYKDYLKIYLNKAALLDKVIKTKYTAGALGEYKTYVLRKVLKAIRKTMIGLHLHNPYTDK